MNNPLQDEPLLNAGEVKWIAIIYMPGGFVLGNLVYFIHGGCWFLQVLKFTLLGFVVGPFTLTIGYLLSYVIVKLFYRF